MYHSYVAKWTYQENPWEVFPWLDQPQVQKERQVWQNQDVLKSRVRKPEICWRYRKTLHRPNDPKR